MMEVVEEGSLYSIEGNIHFTYKPSPDMSSLCQGDVLCVTDEMRKILKEVHPYFLNEQYKYFMVLTQSCDLVRRNAGKCKTPYITLAAVRSFDDFFENRLLSDKCAEKVNGYLLVNSKQSQRAYQLLERLYNNTEPDYFFLYKEEALNFPKSMVASLKVSIALKSSLHYDQCLSAKILELSEEFKAKLGWLVGNIYSRVGTTDWESIMTPQQRTSMLNEELCAHCVIGSKDQLRELKKELQQNAEQLQSQEEAVEFISKCHIDSQYDKVIKELEKIIASSSKKIPQEEKEKLILTIKSRSALKALIPNQP